MEMKILTSTQKHLALLGIIPTQSVQSNLRNVFVHATFGVSALFSCMFFIYKAETFVDISTSIYTTSSMFINEAYFAVFVWEMPKIFELIETLENHMQKSKFALIIPFSFSTS